MAFRTGNPTLGATTFDEFSGSIATHGTGAQSGLSTSSELMTLEGTVSKSSILLFLLLAGASIVWYIAFAAHAMAMTVPLMIVGCVGGFILALVTTFKRTAAPITAPIYAIFEGLALGGISAYYEVQYPGLPMQAVGLTFATLFALLIAYSSRLIKPSENFKLGVVAATGGIAVLYMVSFALSLFHINVPFIWGSGPIGIAVSVFLVILASANLVLDFDFIETGVEKGAPKYMEWYSAFGLLVTLVWLYLEILRLLAKFASRSKD